MFILLLRKMKKNKILLNFEMSFVSFGEFLFDKILSEDRLRLSHHITPGNSISRPILFQKIFKSQFCQKKKNKKCFFLLSFAYHTREIGFLVEQ